MSYAERSRQESLQWRPSEPVPTPPRWMTRREVAAELRLGSEDTVSSYVESGQLTGYRLAGGHLRFKRSDVEALLTVVPPKTKKNGDK